jgi:hypothetical protein
MESIAPIAPFFYEPESNLRLFGSHFGLIDRRFNVLGSKDVTDSFLD